MGWLEAGACGSGTWAQPGDPPATREVQWVKNTGGDAQQPPAVGITCVEHPPHSECFAPPTASEIRCDQLFTPVPRLRGVGGLPKVTQHAGGLNSPCLIGTDRFPRGPVLGERDL